MQGKKQFYPKAETSLKSQGYQYYDGDRDIRGKGSASKPDYIATKGNLIIIGEIKSPMEGPMSGNWREIQNSDTEGFKSVRLEVKTREEEGKVPKEIGGHEIIIRGQIVDYANKRGKTYHLPAGVSEEGATIKGGYTLPLNQSNNVEQALENCKKDNYEKIDTGNGAVTFIFSL